MKQSKIYLDRIAKLQQTLKDEKIDVYLIENSVDLFYLTGMKMSLGHLFVDQNKCALFVDGRYAQAAKTQSAAPAYEMIPQKEIDFIKGAKSLAFDGDKISYSNFVHFRKLVQKAKVNLVSKPEFLKLLRLIKDSFEIQKMKNSAKFAYEAYQFIRKKLKKDITERELAKELEIYCLKNGAEKMSFEPIIAFGKNTALPHHHPGETKLKENDIILFDLGVVLDGYCSDMTRVDFKGKVDPKLRELHEVNRLAQRKALEVCKPGVALKELDLAARKVMADAGLEQYFIHSLGHGIGLEVHEYPRIKHDGVDRNLKLEAGMAITIEPGLYLPGKGGVRYEDTVVITSKGYTNLYPSELNDLHLG